MKWAERLLRPNEHRVIASPGEQAAPMIHRFGYLLGLERCLSIRRVKGSMIPLVEADGDENILLPNNRR